MEAMWVLIAAIGWFALFGLELVLLPYLCMGAWWLVTQLPKVFVVGLEGLFWSLDKALDFSERRITTPIKEAAEDHRSRRHMERAYVETVTWQEVSHARVDRLLADAERRMEATLQGDKPAAWQKWSWQ